MSRKGGVSELEGLFSSFSGDLSATEASFDRKGSPGFRGGKGILAHAVLLKHRRLKAGNDEDCRGNDDVIGSCRLVTIASP